MPLEATNTRLEKQKINMLPARMPWVIPVNCDGCAGCVNQCKRGCLELTETNVEGIFVPWLKEPHECSGCGRCANVCVMGAISMTSYVDRAIKRFTEERPQISK